MTKEEISCIIIKQQTVGTSLFHYSKKIIWKIVKPRYYKSKFLKKINPNGRLLDVGCGNNSPYNIKTRYPNIKYTGIDVGNCNQTKHNLADNYIMVKPENFSDAIANLPELFDTVISSHNIEHCNRVVQKPQFLNNFR